MTTYKMADGSLIAGEFSWVTDVAYLEDLDEPQQIVVETWVRSNVDVVTLGPGPFCGNCGAELPKEARDNEAPSYCSKECYDEVVASEAADRKRDEMKFEGSIGPDAHHDD